MLHIPIHPKPLTKGGLDHLIHGIEHGEAGHINHHATKAVEGILRDAAGSDHQLSSYEIKNALHKLDMTRVDSGLSGSEAARVAGVIAGEQDGN